MLHFPTNPYLYHVKQMQEIRPALTFSPEKDYDRQKRALEEKLRELLALPALAGQCAVEQEAVDDTDPRFDEVRFVYESEPGLYVPAHLIFPKNFSGKLPLVICLQGHSTGMHVSLARERYPSKKPIKVEGDRDFCIQAVERGYAALALEQRGFGEMSAYPDKNSCGDLTSQALMMGRTLLGERLADISNAITAVGAAFPFLNMEKIGITGNSGGGTSSYYAACLDQRIKVSMPSSSFCGLVPSWGALHHCPCAYLRDALQYFDMADLAALIAPRYLIAVNGRFDHIQPFTSAQSEFERMKEIFACAGASGHCAFVAGPEGHRFYADLAWPVFDRFLHA